LELDPAVEAPRQLGPLIDPEFHSCGSVQPHGERLLAHPEAGFYIVGMKSYGRAPTFLMATGYEQVRSIAAALAGDRQAADDVHLVLPETGVCSTDLGGTCDTPPQKPQTKDVVPQPTLHRCCSRLQCPPVAKSTRNLICTWERSQEVFPRPVSVAQSVGFDTRVGSFLQFNGASIKSTIPI